MPAQFVLNGKNYSHKKLDAFTQLFISRKTAPMFADMREDLRTADILGSMSEEDLDAVLKKIMPFVERQMDGSNQWSPIYVKSTNTFAYDDITGGELLEIMFAILMEYLPDFFSAVDHLVYGTPPQV